MKLPDKYEMFISALIGVLILLIIGCFVAAESIEGSGGRIKSEYLEEIARVFPEASVYTIEKTGTTTKYTLQDRYGLLKVEHNGSTVDLTTVKRLYKQNLPITDITLPTASDNCEPPILEEAHMCMVRD